MCSELPLCTAFPKAICKQAHSDTSKLKTSSWLPKWQGTPTSHLQEHTPQKLHHPGQHHNHSLPLPALLGGRQRAPMAASPLCSLSLWAHTWSQLAGASPGESQQTQALLLIQLWDRFPSLAGKSIHFSGLLCIYTKLTTFLVLLLQKGELHFMPWQTLQGIFG